MEWSEIVNSVVFCPWMDRCMSIVECFQVHDEGHPLFSFERHDKSWEERQVVELGTKGLIHEFRWSGWVFSGYQQTYDGVALEMLWCHTEGGKTNFASCGNPVKSLLFPTTEIFNKTTSIFIHSKFYFGAPCLHFSHFKGVLGIEDIVVLAACDAISPLWILPAGVLRFTFKFELPTGPCPFISRSKGMHSADVASVQALGHSVAHGWLELEATAQCPIHRLSLQTPHHTTHMLHLKPLKMSTWERWPWNLMVFYQKKLYLPSVIIPNTQGSLTKTLRKQDVSATVNFKACSLDYIHYLSLLPV